MSEDAPHKSHVWHWVIGVVMALVLYVGSERPVTLYVLKRAHLDFGTPAMKATMFFYKPANWLWFNSPLKKYVVEWHFYWASKLDMPT